MIVGSPAMPALREHCLDQMARRPLRVSIRQLAVVSPWPIIGYAVSAILIAQAYITTAALGTTPISFVSFLLGFLGIAVAFTLTAPLMLALRKSCTSRADPPPFWWVAVTNLGIATTLSVQVYIYWSFADVFAMIDLLVGWVVLAHGALAWFILMLVGTLAGLAARREAMDEAVVCDALWSCGSVERVMHLGAGGLIHSLSKLESELSPALRHLRIGARRVQAMPSIETIAGLAQEVDRLRESEVRALSHTLVHESRTHFDRVASAMLTPPADMTFAWPPTADVFLTRNSLSLRPWGFAALSRSGPSLHRSRVRATAIGALAGLTSGFIAVSMTPTAPPEVSALVVIAITFGLIVCSVILNEVKLLQTYHQQLLTEASELRDSAESLCRAICLAVNEASMHAADVLHSQVQARLTAIIGLLLGSIRREYALDQREALSTVVRALDDLERVIEDQIASRLKMVLLTGDEEFNDLPMDEFIRSIGTMIDPDVELQVEVCCADAITNQQREAVSIGVREGIANARRHGRCSRVVIRFFATQREAILTCTDDGIGTVLPTTPGLGSALLTARTKAVGGAWTLGRDELGGTELRVSFPLSMAVSTSN